MKLAYQSFRSTFGWCAIVGRDNVLHASTFGHRTAEGAAEWLHRALPTAVVFESRSSRWNQPLAERIVAALSGEPDEFRDVPLSLSHLTPFGNAVVAACRKIDWGATRSYAELALDAGSPGAARAVGRVMSTNRMSIVVPCHRVLGSGRSLGGYSAPEGLTTKRRLLDLEAAAMAAC